MVRARGGADTLMPQELERKFVSLAGFKSLDEGHGGFEGYGNDKGVLDSYDDITVDGCFADGLQEFIQAGWSAPDHEWGIKDEIGIIADAREDDRGLFVRTEFHPTDDAQRVRAKVKHRLEKGKAVNLSIGYVALKWRHVSGREAIQFLKDPSAEVVARLEKTARVRLLLKVKVYEVSVVSVGANPNSAVTEAKSMSNKGAAPAGVDVKGIFEERVKERTNSLWFLFDVLCDCIWQIEYAAYYSREADIPFDAAALVDEAFAEFTARARACVLERIGEEDSTVYDYLGVTGGDAKSSQSSDAAPARPLAGVRFAAHSETVLAAVKGLAERAKSIHETRANEGRKEGRTLSAASRDRIKQSSEGIGELLTGMTAVKGDLDDLLAATESAQKSAAPSRARALRLKFLKFEASLNGVAVSGE